MLFISWSFFCVQHFKLQHYMHVVANTHKHTNVHIHICVCHINIANNSDNKLCFFAVCIELALLLFPYHLLTYGDLLLLLMSFLLQLLMLLLTSVWCFVHSLPFTVFFYFFTVFLVICLFVFCCGKVFGVATLLHFVVITAYFAT